MMLARTRVRPLAHIATRMLATTSKAAHRPKAVAAASRKIKPSSAGRIVLTEEGRSKRAASQPKLCSGCGTEIIAGGRTAVAGGTAAMENSLSTGKKKARYSDVTDQGGAFLCQRCKALQAGQVWGAYDALEDLDPSVFKQQLKHIVGRRQFGLCIKVVDATDFEGTIVASLRNVIASTPVILAVNKCDLLPRVGRHELGYMKARARKRGINCIDAHAVSARTGEGIVGLAEAVLNQLGGRDVFVVGAANVGKSSLVKLFTETVSENLRFKGTSKQAGSRRNSIGKFQVTTSHLPGTTLQAIRVPCFESNRHALWDTPGILSDKALTYALFPAHLMEPLARPQPVEIRDVLRLGAGETLVFEASWLRRDAASAEDGGTSGRVPSDPAPDLAPALARLDVLTSDARGRGVELRVFAPPAITLRVVPTAEAPQTVDVDSEVIHRIQRQLGGDSSKLVERMQHKRQLEFYQSVVPEQNQRGYFAADVCFASLGWVTVESRKPCSVGPFNVKGSLWAKRNQPMYPSNLAELVEREQGVDESVEAEDVKRRLSTAAREGRHEANRRREEKVAQSQGYMDNDWGWD